MDMKSTIANVFENKQYDDLYKIRWLYLYVCNLFSYDLRFIYANDELKEKIYYRNINSIEENENFEIVCYAIACFLKDILVSYGYECEIIRENQNKFSHVYIQVKCGNYVLKLDPTKRHDLTRVKIHSNTLDFTLLNDNIEFYDALEETDSIINNDYSNMDKDIFYNNETIEKMVRIVEEGAKSRKISECQCFYEKIEYVYSLINSRTDLKRYDDIDFYFSYLIKKFKLNEKMEYANGENVKTISRIKPALFFRKGDKSMRNIINLAIIQYDRTIPPILYLIKKEGENFKAREIYKDEAFEILKQYENPMCQLMFESVVTNLSANVGIKKI